VYLNVLEVALRAIEICELFPADLKAPSLLTLATWSERSDWRGEDKTEQNSRVLSFWRWGTWM